MKSQHTSKRTVISRRRKPKKNREQWRPKVRMILALFLPSNIFRLLASRGLDVSLLQKIGVYSCRTARSDRYHWRARRLAATRRAGGEGSGSSNELQQQLQAAWVSAPHKYHSAYKRLPMQAGGTKQSLPSPNIAPPGSNRLNLSWLVGLAPFIEQQALWEQISRPLDSDGDSSTTGDVFRRWGQIQPET